ncbi:DUF7547 family protein [Natrarchaeobaculum sulfurireducens]|uniref:Uncharacterized protein n=1 Tax=Natrarchaeobaculum sulfurireducens TaxID=2044521 RepID=A0A346PQ75_9EURY|nr:hypothetical protein [Natrarchaeobaculum sulfurireducens]AXR81670.1 hypothetical protein AArcMg_1660 [Natrarchaeobaculum sulfurireducens]
MVDQDDELAEAVRELTRTIDDLRTELHEELEPRRRRPPLRPPTPRELLAFTDEVALPTLLTVLESSVRALEAFQRGLELVRTQRDVRDRTAQTSTQASERATALRRTTLSQLDSVLAELQRAASEGTLPADDQARDLLSEARELRDDVDRRLREATSEPSSDVVSATDAVRIDVEDGQPTETVLEPEESDEPESAVDIDAELETLKDRYGADEDTGDGDEAGSNVSSGETGTDAADGSEDGGDRNDGTGSSDDEGDGSGDGSGTDENE